MSDVKIFLMNKLYQKWLKENKEQIIKDLKERMLKSDEYLVFSPEEAYEYMEKCEAFKEGGYWQENKRLEDIT